MGAHYDQVRSHLSNNPHNLFIHTTKGMQELNVQSKVLLSLFDAFFNSIECTVCFCLFHIDSGNRCFEPVAQLRGHLQCDLGGFGSIIRDKDVGERRHRSQIRVHCEDTSFQMETQMETIECEKIAVENYRTALASSLKYLSGTISIPKHSPSSLPMCL